MQYKESRGIRWLKAIQSSVPPRPTVMVTIDTQAILTAITHQPAIDNNSQRSTSIPSTGIYNLAQIHVHQLHLREVGTIDELIIERFPELIPNTFQKHWMVG